MMVGSTRFRTLSDHNLDIGVRVGVKIYKMVIPKVNLGNIGMIVTR